MKTSKRSQLSHAEPLVGPSGFGPGETGHGGLAGTRGAVFVEYVALLLLVSIGGATAVLSIGIPLVTLYRYQQLLLSLPIP